MNVLKFISLLVLIAVLGSNSLYAENPAQIEQGSMSVTTHYVSQNGDDDAGDGSKNRPWRTLRKANSALMPGDTVEVAAGVYKETISPSSIAFPPL